MFQWPGKFRPAYRRLVPATDAVVLQASPHGSGHPNARGLHAPAKPNRVDGRTSPAMALSPLPRNLVAAVALGFDIDDLKGGRRRARRADRSRSPSTRRLP